MSNLPGKTFALAIVAAPFLLIPLVNHAFPGLLAALFVLTVVVTAFWTVIAQENGHLARRLLVGGGKAVALLAFMAAVVAGAIFLSGGEGDLHLPWRYR